MRRPITWLITDTHFYHDAMMELCGRPADFNEQIMRNLRYLVADQDLLIHLGDVIFYKYPLLKAMMDSVKGRKILTLGNHDRRNAAWYGRNGFDAVVDMFVLNGVLFSHKPIEVFPSGVTLNIHGHWHNNDHHTAPPWWSLATHRILSIEKTNYTPVKLEEFINARPA